MILLLVTIIPSLIILAYFIYSDKFREPVKAILIVLLLGVLIAIPAGYLNNFVIKNFSNYDTVNNALLVGFFAGGLVEELLKFSILYFYVSKMQDFDEPMDGIVYGVTASLGFATLENFEYVYLAANSLDFTSMEIAIGRALTAIPMHGLNGCVMGFYFGMMHFTGNKKYLGYAVILPIIFHGSYNFLLHFNFLFALMIIIILIIFSLKLHKILKEMQIEKQLLK
jgi:protease PrsW|tara:strand:- start:6081 stop:6755 length:675 start_codon:yes stop_codon:yes gene_type:complete